MKKTLFGGMKIKGPSGGKAQQHKDKPSQQQTSPKNEPHQQKQQLGVLNMSKAQTQQSPMPANLQTKPQLRHEKTSLSTVLKEEQPKIQRKKSMKQDESKRIQSTEIMNKSNISQQFRKNDQLIRNEQQDSQRSYQYDDRKKDVSVHKKSFSQRNYNENIEEREEARDKSVVVGNYKIDEQKQLNTSYKSVKLVPKSNPILNSLKKVNNSNKVNQKGKDIVEQRQKDTICKSLVTQPQSISKQLSKPLKRQRSSIMQQLSQSHTRLIESMILKKQSRQKIVSLQCSIMQLRQKLSVLTNQQNQCVAMQDYEQADRLQQQIQVIGVKIGEQEIEVNFVQQTLNQLEYDSIGLLKDNLQEEKRTIRRIKLVELDIEDQISHYKRQEEMKIAQSQLSCQLQSKKLNNVVSDLKKQTQLYKQYQTNLNYQLNQKKQPLQKILTQEQQKKTQLQQSIKQLQQKLKKKKALLKTTLASIQTTTNKLNLVDQQYQDEKQTLSSKLSQIQKLQQEKQTHSNKLKQIQTQIAKMQTIKDSQINFMTIEKQSYHKLSTDLQHFFQTTDIDYYLKQKKTVIEEYIKHSKELKHFEDSHKQKRQRVKELEFEKSSLESQTSSKQQKIKQLKSKIPSLQKDQKQFSIIKNFKAAAMKKSEIQQCQQQINRIKKAIQQSFGRQAQLEKQLQQIRKQQQQHVEQENRLRKQLVVSQYKLGLQKRSEIRKQLQWLRGLELDNKGRMMYQGKLVEELQSLQDQLNYIAQEYEFQQHQQQQVYISTRKTNRQEKLNDKNINNEHSSYVPLVLGENDEDGVGQQLNQQQDNNTSSQKNIQSSSLSENSSDKHSEQQKHEDHEQQQQQQHYNQLSQQHEQQQQGEQQEGSNSHDQDQEHLPQEQSAYQPLSIYEEGGIKQDKNDDHRLQQSEQGEEQDLREQNYRNIHQYDQQKGEQEQTGGYVPLQLD